MSTVIVRNTTRGGFVLPLGDGLHISGGEEVPMSSKDVAEAKKNLVVRDWFASGALVEEGAAAPPPPPAEPATSADPAPVKARRKPKASA